MQNNNDALLNANEEANKISKESLQIALILLMSKKDLEKISITELVKKAGVSRATFYRNYSSKYELINDIIKEISINLKAINKDLSVTNNYENFYLLYFEKCMEYQKEISAMFKINVPIRELIELPSKISSENEKNKNNYYEKIALQGAFFSIFSDWVHSNFEKSPKEMAKICNNLFGDIRKYI